MAGLGVLKLRLGGSSRCRRLSATCAVQLDVADPGRVDAGALVGGAQHGFLALAAGHGQPVGGAVVGDRAAPDHAVHRVAVGQRGGQRLEHHHAAALAAHVPVGPRVEGVAPPGGRQAAEPGRRDGGLADQVQVDAARQGHRRLAAPQALHRGVHGDQRRGLPGVHREARAAQPQQVGHPVCQDAAVGAGQGRRADGPRAAAREQCRVVVPDGADEHAGVAVPEGGGEDARVLQRLPRQLQHQPLLRVHRDRLARRDPEERRVEGVHPVQEAAAGDAVRPRVGRAAQVPAVVGHLRDGVHAVTEQCPERRRVGRLRQSARQADHRDRVRFFVPGLPLVGHHAARLPFWGGELSGSAPTPPSLPSRSNHGLAAR